MDGIVVVKTGMFDLDDPNLSPTFYEATTTVHKLDEKFIPDTIARKKDILTPVQSDWDTHDESDLSYVKNRTHYSEAVYSYSFNGNLDEYDVLYSGDNGLGRGLFVTNTAYVKVSPTPLTREQLLGAKIVYRDDTGVYNTMYVGEGNIIGEGEEGYGENTLIVNKTITSRGLFANPMIVLSILEDGEAISADGLATTFAKGLYVVTDESLAVHDATISKENILQLDEKYIPNTIARITDIPDVSGQITAHNTATDTHNDIRLLIEGLATRLNTLADSDDITLDQMSEIVTYIKNNKTLIESVTTNKVNVSDIINNLTTNVNNKPLSAAQGVVLKALIDTLDTDKLDASSLTSAINTALAQAKASGEFDGKDGTNATITSVTATVSNTVGTPSVSVTLGGTESARTFAFNFTNIKGATGATGANGKTPVRGTDYWTDADKAEIKSYVDEAILGGAW
jgi:hypothetical protein